MSRTLLALLLLATGCATQFERVEVDTPENAHVVILEGIGTPRIETQTPFVGNFEAVSLSDWAAYSLEFDLDAKAAAKYGASGPIKLYGHLAIGPQTEITRRLTLVVKMPEDSLQALVSGNKVEIETFVVDPNAEPKKEVARLTMRTSPF